MKDIDTKRLRELAAAATPGPWRTANGKGSAVVRSDHPEHDCAIYLNVRTCEVDECVSRWQCDSRFIAAFNPATAIQLLDRIAELEQVLVAQDARIGPSFHDDPVSVAKRWNGDSGNREPDFDMNPEDTASFLAAHVIALAGQLDLARQALEEACRIAEGLCTGGELLGIYAGIQKLRKAGR